MEETSTSNWQDEAKKLVLGDRNASYGDPREDFACLAYVWTGILLRKLKTPLTPEDCVILMAALKLNREMNLHKDDNVIDAHGYLLLLEWLSKGKKPE